MGQNLSNAETLDIMFDPFAMLAMLRRLSRLLSEEIALLNDMKIAEIYKLYNDKIELIATLEAYKQILEKNPETINSIPKSLRDELRDEAAKFEVLVEEDNKQLNRAKEVHKIIMGAVRKVLEKNTIMSAGYNKKGIIDIGNRGVFIAPPVSVNEKI